MSSIAIVVPCCPRPEITLADTVENILHGGFEAKQLHISCEPGCYWVLPRCGSVWLHRNEFCYGPMLHFRFCWQWIYEKTDAEYLMLVENDVLFCSTAAEQLQFIIEREKNNPLGFISLFTPKSVAYPTPPVILGDPWVDIRAGYYATAGQCMCIRRELLRTLMSDTAFVPIDWYIGRYCKNNNLPCWHAVPSQAEHIAEFSAIKGATWNVHKGLNYKDK